MAFLVAAYAIIIAAILGYAVRLWVGERNCRRRMETLTAAESTRRAPDC
jgi:hypothetical protein